MKLLKRKSKRSIEQINNDYLRMAAALGEKQHILDIVIPREIKRLHEQIAELRAEADSLPKIEQPVAKTEEE